MPEKGGLVPRIDAPTVREHREMVRERLIDVVEEMLRENPAEPLAAGAVAERAGLARNSIYRYVGRVEDLYGLVVARYLPPWMRAVGEAVGSAGSPRGRILAWAAENLRQAATSGHGWLTRIGRIGPMADAEAAAIDGAHAGLTEVLAPAWEEVGSPTPQLHAALTRGLVDAGFSQLDAGVELEVVSAAVAQALGDDRCSGWLRPVTYRLLLMFQLHDRLGS